MKRSTMVRLLPLICLVSVMSGYATNAQTGKNGRSNHPGQAMSRTWQWESTITPAERINVPTPEHYTLFLNEGGKAEIRFDCNRGRGEYTIAAGKLSFGPLMSARMSCPEGSLDGPFMRDLQRVASFFIEEGRLYLELPYDSGTMRFREAPTTEQATKPVGDILKIRGIVVHKDLEGGFFAIESNDGRVYDPINLPDRFKKNGLKVNVTAKLRSDMGGIHMVGDIIEIVDIVKQ